MHDCAAPQSVPTGLLLLAVHTDVPVVQDVVPFLQGLLCEQVSPAMHTTHFPVLQTRLAPQLVPSATAVPLSAHTDVPLLQVNVPLWQGLAGGVQAPPGVQAAQTPLSHTLFTPHDVPLG